MPFFDTHAHYNFPKFNSDRFTILNQLPNEGVGLVVNPGCDIKTSRSAVKLAERYSYVYAAVGIHPSSSGDVQEDDYETLRQLAQKSKVVAIGEFGLDYFHKRNPPKEVQEVVMRRQIELALELDLPVIIHDRDAHNDSLNVVLDYPELRGVFHCFAGSPEMASVLLKHGWYLGFDGPVTYGNVRQLRDVATITPLNRIVVETDAPFLTPEPYRGRRNDSSYLDLIIERLAEWRHISPAQLEKITFENGKRLFGVDFH